MMRNAINIGCDLFFPRNCLLCSAPKTYLCEKCLAGLPWQIREVCPWCKKDSPLGLTCSSCQEVYALAGCLQLTPYLNPQWQKILHYLKFKNLAELAQPLGQAAAFYLTEVIEQPRFLPLKKFLNHHPLLVPLPLHQKSFLRRPYNQVALACAPLAKKFNLDQISLLKKTKATPAQVGLNRNERIKNLHNVFKAQISPPRILLCDDVLTTGATLNEAALALKKAGAKTIWGLTFFYD